MARPKTDKTTITLVLPQPVIDELGRLAQKAGLNRSQLMRNIIVSGVDELKTMEKVGLLQGAIYFRDLGDRIGKHFQPSLPFDLQED